MGEPDDSRDPAEENRAPRERIAQLEREMRAERDDHARLQSTLLDSTESLRLALNASRIGLWKWDAERNAIEWDARVCEIFSVSGPPSSFEGYLDVVHPEDRQQIQAVVIDAMKTGVFRTFEHRVNPRADQGEHWVLCVGSADIGANGQVAGLRGGVVDITDKKLLANRLQRAERVQTIGQLSAGVAHNFNNLLAAIIPNLEAAKAAARGLSHAAAIAAALDASLQARDLVKSMLALAGRRATGPVEPANLREVSSRIEAICRMTFPREIALESRIAEDIGFVTMPATDLEQVLFNLLFNARDAIEDSKRQVRKIQLTAERIAPDAGVRVRVTDTGVGIPDAVRARMFEPFFTTKSPQRGTGLGLPTALARAREAGGALECEQTSEEGTTFSLVLPAASPPRPAPVEARPEPSKHRKTVLLVDDEPLVRQAVKQLLEHEGYNVIEAGSADQARRLLERSAAPVDAILLDQSMPFESGLEAAPSIRALSAAPIILFTGLAPEQTPESRSCSRSLRQARTCSARCAGCSRNARERPRSCYAPRVDDR